ncbi:hypothetical protein SANA_27440 [Gottschalkiaceae bacterium SANA]|nr:hypothetical protein SANA_27440 [Gottschalkiaceae bacterium SANA]
MKTYRIWMGVAALIVLVFGLAQILETKEVALVPMQTVDEFTPLVSENAANDEPDSNEQAHAAIQIVEDVDATLENSKPWVEDQEESNSASFQSQPIEENVEAPVESETVILPESEADVEINAESSLVEQSQGEQEIQELGAEEVDTIEDSLSAGDYAKGLSLLAQLPIETVDRFVELRKEGFTVEEQAEVKAILQTSFEGEDLAWIIETYKKLKP